MVCFVCFVDHKAPGAVVPGLQIRPGSMGWRRFAQPPAIGGHTFGMTGGHGVDGVVVASCDIASVAGEAAWLA